MDSSVSLKYEKERWIVHRDICRKILWEDIIFIRKIKGAKYVEYVMKTAKVRERVSLEVLLNILDHNMFLLIDRGNIINLHYVIEMKRYTVCLLGGIELEISRSKRREVKTAIQNLSKKTREEKGKES